MLNIVVCYWNMIDENSSLYETLEESIKNLSPQARGDIIIGFIRKYVRDHPEGVTAPQIAKDLGLSHTTVKKHLNYLVSTRQIYAKVYSPRNIVYFPNGRLSHPYLETILDLGNQRFRISFIENPRGEFVYLQELENIRGLGENIMGGVIIRKENVRKVLDAIYELLEKEEGEEYGK